jgi:extensin-like protein
MRDLAKHFGRRTLLALGAVALVLGRHESTASADEDDYPLDDIDRSVPRHGPIRCPQTDLVLYKGDSIRYNAPTRVHPAFQARLEKFEKVCVTLAEELYGRAPSRLVHDGTFVCRRIGGYPTLLSEHGLGNAIDVQGFDFPALPKDATPPADLPKQLRGAFTIRMSTHWNVKTGPAALHRRYLRTLAVRLIARKDIFRVLLGPSYPGHKTHFHFDMAPYRMVDIFGEEDPSV